MIINPRVFFSFCYLFAEPDEYIKIKSNHWKFMYVRYKKVLNRIKYIYLKWITNGTWTFRYSIDGNDIYLYYLKSKIKIQKQHIELFEQNLPLNLIKLNDSMKLSNRWWCIIMIEICRHFKKKKKIIDCNTILFSSSFVIQFDQFSEIIIQFTCSASFVLVKIVYN